MSLLPLICRSTLSFTEETSDALIQSVSFLGFGSAMEHGSETALGSTLDFDMICFLSYVAHQASVERLRDLGASSVVTDLSTTGRESSCSAPSKSRLRDWISVPSSGN